MKCQIPAMNRILSALALGAFAMPLPAAEPSPEAMDCFQWFQGLAFADVEKAPFVCYTDGGWLQSGRQEPQQPERPGFLLASDDAGFKVLDAAWEVKTFTRTAPGAQPHETVAWKEADFDGFALEMLEDLRKPKEEDGYRRRFGERLSEPAEVFGYAWAAWRRGSKDLPQDLFAEAVKLAGQSRRGGDEPANFRTRLEHDFAHAEIWRAVLAFGGGDRGSSETLAPRTELLAMFENIVRRYPSSPHIPRAKDTVAMLKEMIAEDEAHPPVTDDAFKALPPEEKARELVFRLRDQHGQQFGQPGWCDIFRMQETGGSPAHQLVALGYDAVPALIPALSDKRFSRSVGFHRDFYFSHQVLTVGDCALAVLQRISGLDFYERRTTSSYMSGEEQEAATRKAVEEWWAGVQKKGVKQMLMDQIASGEFSPGPLAEKLKALDGAALLPALLAGAARTEVEYTKRAFFFLLGETGDKKAHEFLLRRMKEEKGVPDRLAAISALLPLKRADVLAALLKEWRDYRSTRPGFDDPFDTLAELLVQSREVAAIEALGSHWKNLTASQRGEIGTKFADELKPGGGHGGSKNAVPPEVLAAAERVLAAALEDRTSRVNMIGCLGDWEFSSPRVSEIALWALHELKPETWSFSPKATAAQREAERLAAINHRRKANGQPPLPEPKPRGKLPPEEALRISEVLITSPKQRSNAGKLLTAAAQGLSGKKLEASTLPDLCRRFAAGEFPGIAGLTVEARRDGDLTGVVLEISFRSGRKSNENGLSHDSLVTLSGETLLNSWGSGSNGHLASADGWKEEIRSLDKLIAAPPDAPFEAHFDLGQSD